jgi:imidazolonepropionase-like amidohydrolase
MKTNGTVLVATLIASGWLAEGDHMASYPPAIQAKLKAVIAARSQMFKDALRVGTIIGFGTDAGVYPHGLNARELSLMTDLGMSPDAALRAATSVDAKLLGIDAQTGTLEAGKIGDVIAVPGNPLVDIHQTEHVVFVMRAGQIEKRP